MDEVYIISEIGLNGNGDLGLTKQLIDKSLSANAVKFQKRTIDLVYTKEELDKPRESPWGTTNKELKERLEYSLEEYKELFQYVKSKGLDFIVSCWDLNSLKEIEETIQVDFHKVASPMLTNREFLLALNEIGKPVILSTGMSTLEEISKALKILKNVKYVLACTSSYPTPVDDVNLRAIQGLQQYIEREKYFWESQEISIPEVGYSNHYNGMTAVFASIALGARCVEAHVTIDRTMFGTDQAASLEHFGELVDGIRLIERMLGSQTIHIKPSELPIMQKLRKINTL